MIALASYLIFHAPATRASEFLACLFYGADHDGNLGGPLVEGTESNGHLEDRFMVQLGCLGHHLLTSSSKIYKRIQIVSTHHLASIF
ncbi:hypothetical protein O181_020486 [Austropuccinia psidii MF-1]|uniref:Uncharacterized protein n=1 Tax=Austropuccinia psidii MF-1 TaxID=1389203 RepID=A0A9Q3CDK0_9BASI|nr:hypothetical protein [Austropuccinia psidii MF-1]